MDKSMKKYLGTAQGKAIKMWHHMNERVIKSKSYSKKGIKVNVSKEEFLKWVVPEIGSFMLKNPNQTPSLDRIDPEKNYELTNIRVISREINFARSSYTSRWLGLKKDQTNEEVFTKTLTIVNSILSETGKTTADFIKFVTERE